MDRARLEEIRERCNKATVGPWLYDENAEGTEDAPVVYFMKDGCKAAIFPQPYWDYADAEFAAAARTDIPELLDYVEELENIIQQIDENDKAMMEFQEEMDKEEERNGWKVLK